MTNYTYNCKNVNNILRTYGFGGQPDNVPTEKDFGMGSTCEYIFFV